MASIEVINQSKADPKAPIEIQLSDSNIVYRGPAGHTPVKGVDYFTQQDINQILAQVPDPDLTPYATKEELTPLATKAEVATAIQQAESGLLKRSIVQTLPVVDISGTTIYMVPKTGSAGDIYDEYLYVNNNWEHIGSTEVDLTDYATKAEVETVISAIAANSMLKRPLRIITVNLVDAGYPLTSFNSIFGINMWGCGRIPMDVLFPSVDDYNWVQNAANSTFFDYPFVFYLNSAPNSTYIIPQQYFIVKACGELQNEIWFKEKLPNISYMKVLFPFPGSTNSSEFQATFIEQDGGYGQRTLKERSNSATAYLQWYPNFPYSNIDMDNIKNLVQTWTQGAFDVSSNKIATMADTTYTAGTGINISGSTISLSTEYLTNSDVLAIWNGNN